MHTLAAEERSALARDGFFMRDGGFASAELAGLRDAVESVHRRVLAASGAAGSIRFAVDDQPYERVLGSMIKWEATAELKAIRSMEPCAHLDPRLGALLADPRLAGPAAALLGETEVSVFTDKLNFKRAGGSPFPWHQDTPYWAFGCAHLDRLVSVQLYLDDATRENGCLWIIPGSHRLGFLPTFQDRGRLGRLYTDLRRVELAEPRALELPQGSLIFFDGSVVHGSRRNRTPVPRRALIATYQPPSLPRWSPPPEP
jgi:hypothetical protein